MISTMIGRAGELAVLECWRPSVRPDLWCSLFAEYKNRERPCRADACDIELTPSERNSTTGSEGLRQILGAVSCNVGRHPAQTTDSLLVTNIEGNARELLRGQFGWTIPSPDGRYLAQTELVGTNNVWRLEDF